MYNILCALRSLVVALLRLPFDLLFLGYDFVRLSLWVLLVRPLRRFRDPTELNPVPLACASSEAVPDQEGYAQLCGPARKYGSPWLYRLLCRWCTVGKVADDAEVCATCQSPNSFTFSPLRHVLAGLALLTLYLAAGVTAVRVAAQLARLRASPPAAAQPAARLPTQGVPGGPGEDAQQRRQRAVEQVQAAQKLRADGKTAEARLGFEAASALDEANVEAHTGLAECAYELGLYPEAELAIGQVLQTHTDSFPAYYTLARIERATGKVGAATEHAKKALSLNPQSVEAMLLLSACHLAAGRYDDAVAQAQAALALGPENPRACLALADAELVQQKLPEAEAHYRKASELDPNLLSARTGQARILRLRRDHSAAIDMLNGILAKDPDATDASVELAEVHVARGRVSAAIAVLRGLREKQPRFYLGRVRLAELLVHSGKTNAGYIVARDLLADDPGNIPAHLLLADVFLRNGFPTLASEHCRTVLARNAGLVVAIKLLTRACLAAQEYHDGSTAIRRLVELRPMDLEAKVMLAYCYDGMGEQGMSIELLEAAATALPTSPVPLVEMGSIHRRRGDLAAAAAAYERALARAPEDPVVLSASAALMLDGEGPKDRALELALKAAKLLPGNPAVADTLGWAYCQQGEFGKAMECLVYAAMQARENPAVRYHLAVALYGKGQAAKASEQLQQALAMDQEFTAAPQATALLEKIRAELKQGPAPSKADPE